MSGAGFNDYDKLAAARELAASFKGGGKGSFQGGGKGSFKPSQGRSCSTAWDSDDVRPGSRLSNHSTARGRLAPQASDPRWERLDSEPIKTGTVVHSSIADFLNRVDGNTSQLGTDAAGEMTEPPGPIEGQGNTKHAQAASASSSKKPARLGSLTSAFLASVRQKEAMKEVKETTIEQGKMAEQESGGVTSPNASPSAHQQPRMYDLQLHLPDSDMELVRLTEVPGFHKPEYLGDAVPTTVQMNLLGTSQDAANGQASPRKATLFIPTGPETGCFIALTLTPVGVETSATHMPVSSAAE